MSNKKEYTTDTESIGVIEKRPVEFKRHYLTSEELAYISNQMIIANGEFERIMLKCGLIGQFCCEFNGFEINDETTTNDIYDFMVANKVDVDYEIDNIYDLDNIVKAEFSVTKTLEKVLTELIDSVNESMKNIDPKELMVKLNKISNTNK